MAFRPTADDTTQIGPRNATFDPCGILRVFPVQNRAVITVIPDTVKRIANRFFNYFETRFHKERGIVLANRGTLDLSWMMTVGVAGWTSLRVADDADRTG